MLAEEEKLPTGAEKKPAILVVDDSRTVRSILAKLLKRNGYRCTVASNAEEAQLRLQESEFEVILSDLIMPPGRSGMELLEEVKETHPDMAAIMLTGVDDPDIALECLEAGARTYLVKPVEAKFLRIALRDALSMRRILVERNDLQQRY